MCEVHESASPRERAKKKAFEQFATEVMLCDDMEQKEALLLSYPLYCTHKRDLCALLLCLYEQTWDADSPLPLTRRERLLEFLQLWAGVYNRDFDELMRSAVLEMFESREQKSVLNKIKVIFFQSSINPKGPNKSSSGTLGILARSERAVWRRPFHSFSATQTGSQEARTVCFPSSEFLHPDDVSRIDSEESRGSGEPQDKRIMRIRHRVRAVSLEVISKKGSSLLSYETTKGPKGSLLELKSVDVARQLTIEEFEMYCCVEPRELIGQAWQREDKSEKAPNLVALIERFNKIAYWVATEILTKHELKTKVKYIQKFIKIAVMCYECNNFNSVMQILSGLNNSAVKRLKSTWEAVGDRAKKKMQELESLMNPQSNFKNYRTALSQRRHFSNLAGPSSTVFNTSPRTQSPRVSTGSSVLGSLQDQGCNLQKVNDLESAKRPAIPYVGLFLRYLTYLDENSAFLPSKSQSEAGGDVEDDELTFNANLLSMRWEHVKDFIGFRYPSYRLPHHEATAKYIKTTHGIADDELLYHLSCSSQPSPRRDQSSAMGQEEAYAPPKVTPSIAVLTPWVATTDPDQAKEKQLSDSLPRGRSSRGRLRYTKPLPSLPSEMPSEGVDSAMELIAQSEPLDSGQARSESNESLSEAPLDSSREASPLVLSRLQRPPPLPLLPPLRLDLMENDFSLADA